MRKLHVIAISNPWNKMFVNDLATKVSEYYCREIGDILSLQSILEFEKEGKEFAIAQKISIKGPAKIILGKKIKEATPDSVYIGFKL
ncbi:MAG: hypothetical protein WC511_02530 [Candidatus Pacearchaeota archaeon]